MKWQAPKLQVAARQVQGIQAAGPQDAARFGPIKLNQTNPSLITTKKP